MKHESNYSSKLVEHLREHLGGSIVFKHADGMTSGIPDISVNWRKKTTWLEVKVGRGGAIKKDSLQDTNIKRLSSVMRSAFYVVYYELSTEIMHPITEETLAASMIPENHRLVEMFHRRAHAPEA